MQTRSKFDPVVEALRRPRYEVIPLDGIEQAVLDHVPKETTLAVTSSPSRGVGPTLDLAESLSGLGYQVVPHLAARLVRDGAHLAEILDRMRGMGAREVFVIAGDADEPAGEFEGPARCCGRWPSWDPPPTASASAVILRAILS